MLTAQKHVAHRSGNDKHVFRNRNYLLLPLLLILISAGCKDKSSSPGARSLQPAVQPLPTCSMTIAGKPFTVELAYTRRSRQQGLMYRKSLAPDHGMLFIFAYSQTRIFHMNNCLIDLDIAFLARDGRIVKTMNMKAPPPGVPSEYYPSDSPVKYALELPAGSLKQLHLKSGQVIPIPARVKNILPERD